MTNSGRVFERLDTVQPLQHEHESASKPAIRLVEPSGPRVEDFELPSTYLAVKYALSRVAAAVLLVVLAPVFAVIAGLLRIKLGKGVIYRQSRVGRNGEDFEILKFRTMAADRRTRSHDVEHDRRQTHKSDDDPRHNSLGRLLRKTSLDELPQLWNVVRGDMTLVGPRPELSSVADQYGFRHHPRHVVVPGITGLWQVSEYRHELLHEHIEVDVEYVQQVSLGLDLRILGRTLMAFVRPTGR
jgi:lipopolysaccharide/colanic/teichoic acid biosynthesis glycosyltransferase